jgi:hypothetical protein
VPPVAAPDRGHVNRANFDEITIGMSQGDVDVLLGKEHRFTADGEARVELISEPGPTKSPREARSFAETAYEEGDGSARKRAIITFNMPSLTVKEKELFEGVPDPGHVTEDNFSQIRLGMTPEEVNALLGREHRKTSFKLGPGLSPYREAVYVEGAGLTVRMARIQYRNQDGRFVVIQKTISSGVMPNEQFPHADDEFPPKSPAQQ